MQLLFIFLVLWTGANGARVNIVNNLYSQYGGASYLTQQLQGRIDACRDMLMEVESTTGFKDWYGYQDYFAEGSNGRTSVQSQLMGLLREFIGSAKKMLASIKADLAVGSDVSTYGAVYKEMEERYRDVLNLYNRRQSEEITGKLKKGGTSTRGWNRRTREQLQQHVVHTRQQMSSVHERLQKFEKKGMVLETIVDGLKEVADVNWPDRKPPAGPWKERPAWWPSDESWRADVGPWNKPDRGYFDKLYGDVHVHQTEYERQQMEFNRQRVQFERERVELERKRKRFEKEQRRYEQENQVLKEQRELHGEERERWSEQAERWRVQREQYEMEQEKFRRRQQEFEELQRTLNRKREIFERERDRLKGEIEGLREKKRLQVDELKELRAQQKKLTEELQMLKEKLRDCERREQMKLSEEERARLLADKRRLQAKYEELLRLLEEKNMYIDRLEATYGKWPPPRPKPEPKEDNGDGDGDGNIKGDDSKSTVGPKQEEDDQYRKTEFIRLMDAKYDELRRLYKEHKPKTGQENPYKTIDWYWKTDFPHASWYSSPKDKGNAPVQKDGLQRRRRKNCPSARLYFNQISEIRRGFTSRFKISKIRYLRERVRKLKIAYANAC